MSAKAVSEPPKSDTALLTVANLSRSFGGVKAVADVSLTCAPGERLAVIGPNGAGKTTLFSLLSGFVKPDAGTITFDGTAIQGKPAHVVNRAGMARTFQVTQPFLAMSVFDNIQTGAYLRHPQTAAAREWAEQVLVRFSLEHLRDRLGSQLNVADRKRLEIARAYATQPKLLLLDEVGAGLTPADVASLSALVREINEKEGVAIMFIEHVMALVSGLAHRVVVLSFGSVIAEGTPAEVMNDERVITAYLGGGH